MSSFRSNLMGTKFTVYDNGSNPCKNPGALLEESNTRQELAAICYVSDGGNQTSPSVCGVFIYINAVTLSAAPYGRKPMFWDLKARVR